jgi:adenosylhomocysteine nucleosidase
VIDLFQPSILAMSGICAGVQGNTKLGTVVVADICWEYQAGKWADTGFKIEHYDVPLIPHVRTTLSQLIAKDEKGANLKVGLMDDPVKFESLVIAPMSTGSAVIASKDRLDEIGEQHRKMAALDMEMYGVYKSAEQAPKKLQYFGVKTVVDLADSAKGDTYHEYGSILSARFAIEAIKVIKSASL